MASRSLPGIRSIQTYRMSWLRSDIVAGVVLTTLLVPQGMAYAELAGLPAITGLYTTILCLLGYAVFGPSPPHHPTVDSRGGTRPGYAHVYCDVGDRSLRPQTGFRSRWNQWWA